MDESAAGREDLILEDLRTAIGAFIAERDWEQFHSPKNVAMALSVEVAEIVEHLQWLTEEQSRNLPSEKQPTASTRGVPFQALGTYLTGRSWSGVTMSCA